MIIYLKCLNKINSETGIHYWKYLLLFFIFINIIIINISFPEKLSLLFVNKTLHFKCIVRIITAIFAENNNEILQGKSMAVQLCTICLKTQCLFN